MIYIVVQLNQNFQTMPKNHSYENGNETNGGDMGNLCNSVLSYSSKSSDQLSIIENPKPLTPAKECSWTVGQLAWARVGNFPFWPCMITPDPDSSEHQKMKSHGKFPSPILMLHVRFFGDKGRRSWVNGNAVIEFTGYDDFRKLGDSLTSEVKKKDPKYAAAFLIKPLVKRKWDIAVSEASDVLHLSNEMRLKMFKPEVTTPKSKTASKKISDYFNGSKRKNSVDSGDEPDIKRYKQDQEEKPRHRKQKDKDSNNSERHSEEYTRSPSPDAHDASEKSEENSEAAKGNFKTFYLRTKNIIQEKDPLLTESEIKMYLKKMWKNLPVENRKNYAKIDSDDEVSIPEVKNGHANADLDSPVAPVKEKKQVTEPVKKSRPFNIFKGFKQEKVCQICENTGNLTRCKGPCFSYFHLSCVKPPAEVNSEEETSNDATDLKILDDLKIIKSNNSYSNLYEDENDCNESKSDGKEDAFKCIDCLSGVAPACFVCNEREGVRERCSMLACGKHYHIACVKSWPQAYWQGGRLTCPHHFCHTCAAENPEENYPRIANEKLAKCVRCPSSYHSLSTCLPAGSEILTASQVICPKHYKCPHPPINATWCFLCTRGGSLICCDTCPTSYHLECLGIDAPDGAFICDDCENGRLPLYGELVWVKLGTYRWWPSIICFPHEIPLNIRALPHSPGEFCVMFLGTNNYYWSHRGRAFLYQEGDACTKGIKGKNNVDEAYRRALEEAHEVHSRLKMQKAAAVKENSTRELKPPPYVKLKTNKPVGNVKPPEVESIVACNCEPERENPCGPGTDCLNRILLVECSPDICPAGSKCKNQSFVQREYPAMEPVHTEGRGWGLKTLEAISLGQFVIEYVGEVIDEAEYKRRLHIKKELKNENFYFLTIDNNRMIDAEPKGNLSRFMNHSCEPNCETQKWTVNGDTRVGLFALRDIEPGEELTFNYNLESDGETKKPCLCGAANCSGFIGLKVQKPQVNGVQQKEIEKVKKARKRYRRLVNCWTCGEEISEPDDVLLCDQKSCSKKYHKGCVERREKDGHFSCPWHHCKECGRRTGAHCAFCSVAYCQIHLEGNLFENNERGRFICKVHESIDTSITLTEDEKEESSDMETDKECSSSLCSSSSSNFVEKQYRREPSPRVSIIEVHLSSCEESEESQTEDNLENESGINWYKHCRSKPNETFVTLGNKPESEELNVGNVITLTTSQIEDIIGGKLSN